jgi:ADP-ribose pyrophosphatase YjhB (NUDIX family)
MGYARPMQEQPSIHRTALGAACAIFDEEGRVLLVHHTYGPLNWELPGGLGAQGETPDETATRELLEETGLRAGLDRLTGVYLEPQHDFVPMLHFVFRCRWDAGQHPVPSSPEVSEVGYFPTDLLPTPISDFTERRIQDAAIDQPVRVGRVRARRWRG